MKNLIFTFIIIFAVSASSQNIKKVKVFIDNSFDRNNLTATSIDLEHSFMEKKGEFIFYLDENEFTELQQSGTAYEILIDDWKTYYHSLPLLTDAEKELIKIKSEQKFGVTGFDFGSMGGYYTLAEIESDLDEMFQLYPNLITQKFSIGSSVEGRTIWAAKISDNPNNNENEPSVGFDALVHAREPQSMATQMYFMWYLLENYGTDPAVTYLVDNRELYFVPCFNPDGYEYNHQTDPNGGGSWRKNRRNNGSGCYGVDLNRNFGYQWGYDNIGSSPDPCASTYRGTSAFSEPEAQAIRDLAILKNYGTHFNMHSYGNYYLYPWGYIDEETPDSSSYREFASDMGSFNGYTYGTGPQLLGYPSNGSIRDWMYGEQTAKNKIFGYTIEIGPAFWPSQSQIFPIAQLNVLSNMYHAFVAGEYVAVQEYNFAQEYFLPGDNVELFPELRNKGLRTANNVDVNLSSPSQFVTVNNSNASVDSIEARTSEIVSTPLSFTVSQSAGVETEIPLVFTTSVNGSVLYTDTLTITIGIPVFVFEDSTNNPTELWTITATPSNPKWEATTSVFFSPPTSFTDSKTGNYANNATVTMELTDAIDISGYSNPRFTFKTKYDIEGNWDYGQVSVSTNNGSSWIPLEGEYTEPGEGSFQPNGEPVYDGIINSWVKEDIKLTDYLSNQFKVRFRLRTDGGTRRDGWYIDDIGVFIYTIPTNTKNDVDPVYQFSLAQNYPNPFNPNTTIEFTIPSNVILSEAKNLTFVTLKIYNILGKEITTLVSEEKAAGSYNVQFDANELPSGIYFYTLRAGNFSSARKMILLK